MSINPDQSGGYTDIIHIERANDLFVNEPRRCWPPLPPTTWRARNRALKIRVDELAKIYVDKMVAAGGDVNECDCKPSSKTPINESA